MRDQTAMRKVIPGSEAVPTTKTTKKRGGSVLSVTRHYLWLFFCYLASFSQPLSTKEFLLLYSIFP